MGSSIIPGKSQSPNGKSAIKNYWLTSLASERKGQKKDGGGETSRKENATGQKYNLTEANLSHPLLKT